MFAAQSNTSEIVDMLIHAGAKIDVAGGNYRLIDTEGLSKL